jgi:tRNA uridine 5-carboxymethylaminomethyl modification enzyme
MLNASDPNRPLHYDVVVIGAGHAGCEAALASARAGCSTLVVTPNLDRIGFMPCNPSMGGPGKSQIIAEIDALGGAMARIADMTSLQARELNTSKGPAVRAIRLQCDKSLYALAMKETLEQQENLHLIQDEATGVRIDGVSGTAPSITGVQLRASGSISCDVVIVTAGTFLRARMISGDDSSEGGRAGDSADTRLSTSLANLGLRLKRFKTGTPPRLDARTIDLSQCEVQPADDQPLWLSRDGKLGRIEPLSLPVARDGIFSHADQFGGRTQLRCYQSWTNEETHGIIRANMHRAPMYNGSIEGTGPRYCPSIEDKVGRFADKTSHPIFIEPEGWRSHEAYIQGLSTSLPADIQQQVVRSVRGLQQARITRYGYAVEYDALDATELLQTLECRRIGGLFMAGQVNGTSGYEEAGGQGIIAGANAAARIRGQKPLILGRADAYIGVMIDDLVSTVLGEPYRMLTSRAEYRLILRSDTADARLATLAHDRGLIGIDRAETVADEKAGSQALVSSLEKIWLGNNDRHASALKAEGLAPANRSMSALEVARRPGAPLDAVIRALRRTGLWTAQVPSSLLLERTEVAIKYGSFIDKEEREAARQLRSGEEQLAPDLNYSLVPGLRVEAIQRLQIARPLTVGQAARTAGVTPSDIGALLIHLARDRDPERRETNQLRQKDPVTPGYQVR